MQLAGARATQRSCTVQLQTAAVTHNKRNCVQAQLRIDSTLTFTLENEQK